MDRALGCQLIVVDSRGRYALPAADAAVRTAHRLGGVLSRESAALHHGWAVKAVPDLPHVSVPPKKRKVSVELRRLVHLHRDDLHSEDVDGIATSRQFTLGQCLRTLPFDAALAVADSALRGGVPRSDLRRAAITREAQARARPGSSRSRRARKRPIRSSRCFGASAYKCPGSGSNRR